MREWEQHGTTCALMAVQGSLLAAFAIAGGLSASDPVPLLMLSWQCSLASSSASSAALHSCG